MNVEIRAEAAQFPEKEYINGVTVAVQAVRILLGPYWLLKVILLCSLACWVTTNVTFFSLIVFLVSNLYSLYRLVAARQYTIFPFFGSSQGI